MSANPFPRATIVARRPSTEAERAVLAFFTRARDAAPSQTDSADSGDPADSAASFSIAQICAGTGLDRRSVIEACAVLADGWARDNVPPGREPRLVPVLAPVLAPVGDCDGSDIHYALNGARNEARNDTSRKVLQ